MMELFSRLSSVKSKTILQLLQKIMRQKVSGFDEQVQSYQQIVYGDKLDKLLHSPSARYAFLTKQSLLPLQILLSAADSLLFLIAALQRYEGFMLKKIDSLPVQPLPNHSITMALAEVRCLLYDLLKEATVLQAVLAFRLQRWYQGEEEMQFVSKKRFAYANEAQQCLLAWFSTFSRLHKKTKPYTFAAVKKQGASVSQLLSEVLNRLQQKASQHFKSMRFPFINKQWQLEPRPLNAKKITALVSQSRSYWKSSRYRATLMLLHAQRERDKRIEGVGLHDKLIDVQTMQKQVLSLRADLHWLFHYKTRRLYQAFSKNLQQDREKLAITSLRDNLLILSDQLIQQSSTLLGFVYLPLGLQQLWQQFCHLCGDPKACGAGRLVGVVSLLAQALSLTAKQERGLIQNTLLQFVLSDINSVTHPAFPLVYEYLPQEAYIIQAPKISEIKVFLETESSWQDKLYAKQHLAFLIAGRREKSAKIQWQSEQFIDLYFMECLLMQKKSVASWKRLLDYAECFNLPDACIKLITAVQYWFAFADTAANLSMAILPKLVVDEVNALSLSQWLQRLQQLTVMLEAINPFLNQPQHPYFHMLKAFVERLVRQLCLVAIKANLLNTSLQKICLFFYEHPVLTDTVLKANLKAVAFANCAEYPVVQQKKIISKDDPNLNVLMALCNSIKTLVSNCLVVKREGVKMTLPNLNRQAWVSLTVLNQDQVPLRSYFQVLKQQLQSLSASPFLSSKCQRYSKVVLALFSDRPRPEKLNMIEHLLTMQRESLSRGFFAPKKESSTGINKDTADVKRFGTTH